MNSAGSAEQENAIYMESLEGKLSNLNSAWQNFARNTVNSEVVKSLITLGTTILEFANTDLGRLITASLSATVAINTFNKVLGVEKILKFIGASQTMAQTILAATTAFNVQNAAGGVFSATMYGAGAAVETLTTALLANPLFWITAGGLAIYGIIEAVNTLIPKMETLEKNTDESTKAYKEATDEVKTYKKQLEDINTKIEDIKKQGKISVTDEQELKNLEREKSDLEANLKLTEQLANAKKQVAQTDIMKELDYKSNNPFDFFSQDETEKSIEKAKKLLKEAGNDISKTLGNDRENIRLETQDMMAAYKELASEIEKQKSKISQSTNMSADEAKKEKDKLTELQSAYADLGVHLNKNVTTFKDWYDTLKEGGEDTEDARKQIEALLANIGNTLDIDLVSSLEEDTNAVSDFSDQIADANEKASQFQSALDGNIESMVNYGSNMDLLTTAQEELSNAGYITAETFKSLSDNNLIQYLDETKNGLEVNTQAFVNSTDAIKENALANLQASTYEQIRGVVLEDLASKEKDAGTEANNASSKLENAGMSAIEMGKNMLSAAGDVAQLNTQLAAIGGEGYTPSEDASKKIQDILAGAKKTQTFIESWKPSSSSVAKKSHGSKKSGSKKSSSSKKSSKEEYKATIDTLYTYKNALENAKDSVDKLKDAIKDTDNFNEQEKSIRQIIDALNDEINKTNDLKNAQTNQINDYINQLRQQGFAIDYNASTNELYINNMQHLADFSGDTAKNLEKLINKIQDLNDNNRDLDGTIRDLRADVKDYYEQLEDIPEEKLKKFNELMKEFQQRTS